MKKKTTFPAGEEKLPELPLNKLQQAFGQPADPMIFGYDIDFAQSKFIQQYCNVKIDLSAYNSVVHLRRRRGELIT